VGNILDSAGISQLQEEGCLGRRPTDPGYIQAECQGTVGPNLQYVAEEHRRGAWAAAVAAKVKELLRALGYERWAGVQRRGHSE